MKSLFMVAFLLLAPVGCARDIDTRSEPAVQRVKDPVCDMMVDTRTTRRVVQNGKTYYFCSDECMEKFRSAPESYTMAK